MSGDGGPYGQEIANGIRLAFDSVTADDYPLDLRLVFEDSQGDPTTATSAYRSLRARYRVPVILGDAFSTPTLAIVPLAQRDEVVMFSPTASSPDLSEAGPFFFRNWPTDLVEAENTAAFAMNELGFRNFAVIYSNSDYGIGLKDAFVASVREAGAEVGRIESYNDGDRDFRAQLQNIRRTEPEAIYMPGYFQEFALILRQASELGIDAQFLSCGTFREPKLLEIAGSAAEGVIFAQPYFDAESDDPTVHAFVTKYRERYNEAPGLYAAHGYDAALILLQALRATDAPTGPGIREALSAIEVYAGVTGVTQFLPNGDCIKPSMISVVRDGTFKRY